MELSQEGRTPHTKRTQLVLLLGKPHRSIAGNAGKISP